MNRLKKEKSPYLLQHADNPVDWFPWGDEAFKKAKKEDKPIFLSIGYATCHWCHVMEKECFEDNQIASLMNETFVNIKVDREELPQVDNLYMECAEVLMSSGAGWPLNIILTPDLKPFFAVTYLPPKETQGMIGLDQFINQIKNIWKGEEKKIIFEQADKVIDLFSKVKRLKGDHVPEKDELDISANILFELIDPIFGGLKGEPKFPMALLILFFMQYGHRNKDSRALFFVNRTLDCIQKGGIFDHLGGGFARYAIDEMWHIPHFEKMLYDNALLSHTYLTAWKIFKNLSYRQTLVDTLNYLTNEMQDPLGGFYSAEDADIDGKEGLFYTWTPEEVQQVLDPDQADLFCNYYGVTYDGNFEGRSVLHADHSLAEFALEMGVAEEELSYELSSTKQKLLKRRNERPHPFKDDKILTSWNAFMIDLLAKAGTSLQENKWMNSALLALEFIKKNLWKDKILYRRYRDGESRFIGGLEEYASLIRALITLFNEGQGSEHLIFALELTDIVYDKFKEEGGAFFQTEESEAVLIRRCEFYDGSEPSGNAIHADNLIRLYQITRENRYISQAQDVLQAAKPFIESTPQSSPGYLLSLERYYDENAPTIFIALGSDLKDKEKILQAKEKYYIPHLQLVWIDEQLKNKLSNLPPLTAKNEESVASICFPDRCESVLEGAHQVCQRIEALR